jgi:hypothetical protein
MAGIKYSRNFSARLSRKWGGFYMRKFSKDYY